MFYKINQILTKKDNGFVFLLISVMGYSKAMPKCFYRLKLFLTGAILPMGVLIYCVISHKVCIIYIQMI